MTEASGTPAAREIVLSGHVQSVGFRPFIYHLAHTHGLTGWIRNCTGDVRIHVEGHSHAIDAFVVDIFARKPDLAKPVLKSDQPAELNHYQQFTIEQSEAAGTADIRIPVDLFVCDDCLREFYDPDNRRYQYPFINCTQCGPRYTLITALPYDRVNTTMRDFTLCPACEKEYLDVDDRRFHAEPIACEKCGPALQYVSLKQDMNTVDGNVDALVVAVSALKSGDIVAVKGIGGYHLMCDATSNAAVARIRRLKPRPDKPLAVMFASSVHAPFDAIEQHVELDEGDRKFLAQPSRPLLLVRRKQSSSLASNIAPGLAETGVMLPYSPLHHMLLNRLKRPLVATSANISGEPVLTDNKMVEKRLAHVVDGCLHHNREIARPADDPVYRKIGRRPRPLRLGRGVSPLELSLPFTLPRPVLAVGAHMKNTIALGWHDRAVVSPHIGEMDSHRSLEVFEQTINDLQRLYQVRPEIILRDAHPAYTTHRWAQDYADSHHLPVHDIYHHYAHASSLYGEYHEHHDDNEMPADMLVFAWDGTGYGVDSTLWGGELLLGKAGHWQRVATMRPFYLPGGDRVAREPWRTAAALSWQTGAAWQPDSVMDTDFELLKQAWLKRINVAASSAVGRLFDAASAFTGLCEHASFEGQGPMMLEALCSETDECLSPVEIKLDESEGNIIADWSPVLSMLLDSDKSVQLRADSFHDSLAMLMLALAQRLSTVHEFKYIGCTGGVFQNRILFQRASRLLNDAGFSVFLPELIPVNDAGISYGQIIEYGSTA